MARWFAYGGSLHNFYMLVGGNNYDREAALGITTAYAPDAAIDNLLLRAPKCANAKCRSNRSAHGIPAW